MVVACKFRQLPERLTAFVIPTRLSDGQVVLLLPNHAKNGVQVQGSQPVENQSNLYCLTQTMSTSANSKQIESQNKRNPNYLVNLIDMPHREGNLFEVAPAKSSNVEDLSMADQPLDFTLHRKETMECDDGSVWRPW
ncbi:hypothetical protein RUM43_010141 [Polyplax serrata]|uniref:Uncharacterized protein n=1 Tax=Polyplax serrata TaxID=468196 RepID=A0AAN8PKZ6_POLSC